MPIYMVSITTQGISCTTAWRLLGYSRRQHDVFEVILHVSITK